MTTSKTKKQSSKTAAEKIMDLKNEAVSLVNKNKKDFVQTVWTNYQGCLKKYFQFRGRANRAQFWSFVLVNVLVSFVLNLLNGIGSIFGTLASLYALAVFIPGMAVQFRRLHDTNRPGWWMFIPSVATVIAVVCQRMAMAGSNIMALFALIFAIASLALTVYLIYCYCKKGDAKANKYGQPTA